MAETYSFKINRKLRKKTRIIAAAAGRTKADLVLKNATFVNVFGNKLQTADIAIAEGLIVGIGEYEGEQEVDLTGKIVCPGFLDAHIHLESSLVAPVEFVKAVLPHGTTTVITDPHEIANVMGTDGIDYMLQATEGLPVDVQFMLPSCVPATPLDEAGATLNYQDLDSYYDHSRVQGLAEMMDFVGTSEGDENCTKKIVAAQAHHKKIDGHAPGLTGKRLNAYISAGVYSDHECDNCEEAIEKMDRGQVIMIREGTAAHNLEALLPLLKSEYADRCLFCSDDKHPSDLINRGHIDDVIRMAIADGVDPITAIKAGTHNTARYFLLNNRGAIAIGYLADLAIVDDLEHFNVLSVYRRGQLMYDVETGVAEIQKPEIDSEIEQRAHDTFVQRTYAPEDFHEDRPRGILGMVGGQLTTTDEGYAKEIDVDADILKLVVVERHKNTGHIGIGYLKGYGLKEGAVATSFSHDSHNIIATGTSDEEIALAVNRLIENRGGIVVTSGNRVLSEVVLDIAGLMTDAPLEAVNQDLETAKATAMELGVNDNIDPFMTLSFLSLPVIPTLRLTTRGVFDVVEQRYV